MQLCILLRSGPCSLIPSLYAVFWVHSNTKVAWMFYVVWWLKYMHQNILQKSFRVVRMTQWIFHTWANGCIVNKPWRVSPPPIVQIVWGGVNAHSNWYRPNKCTLVHLKWWGGRLCPLPSELWEFAGEVLQELSWLETSVRAGERRVCCVGLQKGKLSVNK